MCFKSNFKEDPIEFMRNNIVISPLEGPNLQQYTENNTVNLSIFIYDSMNDSNTPDNKVYKIEFEDSEHSIEAYWCPYIDNNVGSVTLGASAKWVFTPAMSGCSLGIGTPAIDGTLRISHANARNSGEAYGVENQNDLVLAMDQQRRVQRHFLTSTESIDNVINYKHYMGAGENFNTINRSTTFGERPEEGGDWKFYTLKYTHQRQSVHGGVHNLL